MGLDPESKQQTFTGESSGEPTPATTDVPSRTRAEHKPRNHSESGRSRTPTDGSETLCKQDVRGSIPLSSTQGDSQSSVVSLVEIGPVSSGPAAKFSSWDGGYPVKVGEPVTGSAGPAVGGATTGGAVVVVVGGAVVVVVVVVATGSHWAYSVSVPEFGNGYESSPA